MQTNFLKQQQKIKALKRVRYKNKPWTTNVRGKNKFFDFVKSQLCAIAHSFWAVKEVQKGGKPPGKRIAKKTKIVENKENNVLYNKWNNNINL